ncbi:MAG: apolipoprotein N-acyltransferase [Dokdonia sp.]
MLFHILSLKLSFKKYVLYISLFLFAWFSGALFWMVQLDNGVYALGIYFSFYLVIFILFYALQKITKASPVIFFPFFLGVEFLLNSSTVSYPWLTLGNALGNSYYLVQWYSITGVLGGSLWLLLLGYLFLKRVEQKVNLKIMILAVSLPIVISFGLLIIKNQKPNDKTPLRVTTIDTEYFTKQSQKARFTYDIIKGIPENEIDYLLLPEMTLRGLDNKGYEKTKVYRQFREELRNNHVKKIIIGTTGVKGKDSIVNSAIMMSKDMVFSKNKNRLVPYTEYIYPSIQPYFDDLFFVPNVPDTSKEIHKLGDAVFICYESFFPYYIAEESKNVELLVLLSSEIFMKGSFYGKKQYDDIVRLRAIETNKQLVKSTSAGKSYVLNTSGKIIQSGRSKFNL